MTDYAKYKSEIIEDVARVLKEKSCQPILFVGSGFSKRYCGAPNWEELLAGLADDCPKIEHGYAYYKQSKLTAPEIGSIFAKAYKEWAWGEAKKNFPKEYFSAEYQEDIFIKHAVAEKLRKMGPDKKGSFGTPELDAEISALKGINPHAVISTNYDTLLEPIFSEYSPVVGQQVIRHAYMSIGEVFKIHGCVSNPSTLTLTEEDYKKFANDKKYLSAKMFTFFVEHPLLFIGYSATDTNVRSILEEIDHMLPEGEALIENIYILEWKGKIEPESYPPREKVINIGDGKSIRIKSISADSFEWVFNSFKSENALEKVNVKLLRSVSHRVFDLVRKGSAQNKGQINFQMLNHAIENPKEFANVYGVAALNNPALLNVMYPFLPNAAAQQIDPNWKWQKMYQLMDELRIKTGFDMRGSDNKFHAEVPPIRRYSQEAIDLLKRFQVGDPLPDLTDPVVTGEIVKAAPQAGLAPAAP